MSALNQGFSPKNRIHGKVLLLLALVFSATGAALSGCSDSIEKARVSGINTDAVAIIDPVLCSGCGACFPVCPQRAIDSVVTPNPNFPQPDVDFLINTDKCTRCGVCFQVCPYAAIGWKR
ncbi:MAG: 4Fe-4S binding protein [Chitinispirillaceae bacterium]|nr:4Fe-4S binding protein [Chitinispirillaceae bacterium]